MPDDVIHLAAIIPKWNIKYESHTYSLIANSKQETPA